MFSKKKIRAFVAVVALTAGASAQAGFVYTDAGGTYRLELKMEKLAELSVKIFGDESRYAQH